MRQPGHLGQKTVSGTLAPSLTQTRLLFIAELSGNRDDSINFQDFVYQPAGYFISSRFWHTCPSEPGYFMAMEPKGAGPSPAPRPQPSLTPPPPRTNRRDVGIISCRFLPELMEGRSVVARYKINLSMVTISNSSVYTLKRRYIAVICISIFMILPSNYKPTSVKSRSTRLGIAVAISSRNICLPCGPQ
jgi:hypothetical protein